MNINIIVNGGAYSSQAGYSALQFAQQACLKGHTITQVFFYRDGVTHANDLQIPLSDEFNAPEAWSRIAKHYNIQLLVCVSAAERRGIINKQQQLEFGKSNNNLHGDFAIAGLGQMLDASLTSDRTVTFN